jgi:hypothetical protein
MEEQILKATHSGVLKIQDMEIPCHVLENSSRILSTRGIMKSLGRTWRGRKYSGTHLPVFLEAKNLKPYISDDLAAVLTPIIFKPKTGHTSEGYRADILPTVCEIYLKARDDNALTSQQELIAKSCEILVRALSRVGVTALVDEATGYQYDRDKDDLEKLLALYLSEERLRWAKTFPDEYYRQLFRLRGWRYSPMSVKRPKLVGKLTNKYVYEMLPPKVLEKLRELNPVKNRATWRREATFSQHLSPEIGQKDLRDHILQLVAIMRVSANWRDFQRNFARAFQIGPEQMELFDDE